MYSSWTSLARAILPLVLAQCGVSTECASYLRTSVAEMRKATGSGCFELEHVVVAARTPSTTTPRVYVQDQRGGPYSAIRAKCDGSPTHQCSAETARDVELLVDGSQVTIRGYYLQGSASGFEEIYLDQVKDEQALLAIPTAATVSVAELSRDARTRAQWFQVVSTEVPVADPLVVYDFSPPEFTRRANCPFFAGFAVIPTSAAPSASAAGCLAGSNPTAVTRPDAREILIGREFFKEFLASTDCLCASASKQHLLSASSAVTGKIEGLLIPEIKPGSSILYQVFQPLSRAAFPISGG